MKRRLDVALVERGLARSRERAQRLIRAGSVEVNGQIATKAGTRVSAADEVAVLEPLRYVGRGGLKLEHALDAFGLDVEGATALDVGASTGGFTDCLLQRGAAHVYAVDVGRGQLVPEIREHPRVTPLEGTDIRQLGALPEPIDLAVIDVSFISLTRALPAVCRLLKPGSGRVVALVKPQFEAGPGRVGRDGIVKDDETRQAILDDVLGWLADEGWEVLGLAESPVRGKGGNVEYLAHLKPPGDR